MRKITFLFYCVTLLLCVTTLGYCEGMEKYFLLTENGINNHTYSEYKSAPAIKTGGTYYAVPEFAISEKGTAAAPTPFSEGVLCNGDTSTNYKRTPCPYAFWRDRPLVSLFFNLKKQYFVSKVRVNILLTPGSSHGMSKIGIYTKDEILDAGTKPLKEIGQPINGWNEFIIDKPTDKIKLDFTAAKYCRLMTVTEIEIWGKELSPQTVTTGE
jgi:hypothetical protein